MGPRQDDPKEIAQCYLEKHKIDRLFQELGSALMYERPENVEQFLLKRCYELKEKKILKEQSSIFNDENLDTLFNMYDQKKTKMITKKSLESALRVIGAPKTFVHEETSNEICKDQFFMICKKALTVTGGYNAESKS